MKSFGLILLIILAGGCASIPVSTMFRFMNFDKQDFDALNVSEIRARVSLSQPATIKAESARMALELGSEQGVRQFSFPLVLVSEKVLAGQDGFFTSLPDRTEYTFTLSDEAQENFQAVQRTSLNEGTKSGFSVGVGFDNFPTDNTVVRLWIALQLSEEDGYFTLIDDAPVEIDKEAGSESNQPNSL